jgi:hypothetical protein
VGGVDRDDAGEAEVRVTWELERLAAVERAIRDAEYVEAKSRYEQDALIAIVAYDTLVAFGREHPESEVSSTAAGASPRSDGEGDRDARVVYQGERAYVGWSKRLLLVEFRAAGGPLVRMGITEAREFGESLYQAALAVVKARELPEAQR